MADALADLVVEGLTAPVTEDEQEAARKPPYPVPSALIVPRERLLGELTARLPSEEDGPRTVTRIKGTPGSYRDVVSALGRPGRFDVADAACALLAIGALDDVDALAQYLPSYSGARRQLVLNRLADGDLAAARAAADRIGDGLSWVGYRDIGAALAERGDTTEFFADWKRYAAGKDRHGIADLRTRLVMAVARDAGWRAALAVSQDTRVGPDFARYAFHAVDINELRQILAGDAAGVLSDRDELTVLAAAVLAASGHNPERDHPLLAGIVDRVIAVDPTTDKATMRWRDAELFGLWPAFGDQATLARVRAAIRTPRYRRELTALPRDIRRSSMP